MFLLLAAALPALPAQSRLHALNAEIDALLAPEPLLERTSKLRKRPLQCKAMFDPENKKYLYGAKEAQKWYDEMCPDDKQNQKNSGWEKIRVTMHIRDTLDEKWKASGGPTGAIIKADLADLGIHDPDHGPAQLMYHLIVGTEWSISFLLYQEWCPLHDTFRFYNGLSAPLTKAGPKIAPYITNEEYLVLVAFLHLMSELGTEKIKDIKEKMVERLGRPFGVGHPARVELAPFQSPRLRLCAACTTHSSPLTGSRPPGEARSVLHPVAPCC